jgi:hypothetical protein
MKEAHAMTLGEGLRVRRALIQQLGRCPCLAPCVRCACLRSIALALLAWLTSARPEDAP